MNGCFSFRYFGTFLSQHEINTILHEILYLATKSAQREWHDTVLKQKFKFKNGLVS